MKKVLVDKRVYRDVPNISFIYKLMFDFNQYNLKRVHEIKFITLLDNEITYTAMIKIIYF